jgi:hypothetical protein
MGLGIATGQIGEHMELNFGQSVKDNYGVGVIRVVHGGGGIVEWGTERRQEWIPRKRLELLREKYLTWLNGF